MVGIERVAFAVGLNDRSARAPILIGFDALGEIDTVAVV
jgi:hypothetical protein